MRPPSWGVTFTLLLGEETPLQSLLASAPAPGSAESTKFTEAFVRSGSTRTKQKKLTRSGFQSQIDRSLHEKADGLKVENGGRT